MSGVIKNFMYLNRRSPYGTIYAWESLEVVLIGAAFDQDVSLAFVDDGVYQLVKGQETAGIGMKNFSPTYAALGDYEVKKIFVETESLEERGLTPGDLQHLVWEDEDDDWAERDSIRFVSRAELAEIMEASDVVFSFEGGSMSTLHTVNKSPFEKDSLTSCLNYAMAGGTVLMLEDGIYGALKGTKFEAQVKSALDNVKVYVLGPDLKARGFAEERVIDGVKVVDYAGFVDLATENDKVQAWL